ncbi:hypothetical protein GLAREA_00194 [Glarea lozoyensis ATCC 20868]|uniref:Uncharacterized protein n=1 Tax=Glarea lozoyensis (strain ATCC 20868 / MF5171) TaxID=1116229 RepID=S3DAM8_GLAL2|nr:uncharacterized protein GLAREA_00194 [Glarea lozoyensis ATCC 20868]EPE29036.1 hypothetical protein GLAREA_00194 [Glarea lozoyensis ATCC 20868]
MHEQTKHCGRRIEARFDSIHSLLTHSLLADWAASTGATEPDFAEEKKQKQDESSALRVEGVPVLVPVGNGLSLRGLGSRNKQFFEVDGPTWRDSQITARSFLWPSWMVGSNREPASCWAGGDKGGSANHTGKWA